MSPVSAASADKGRALSALASIRDWLRDAWSFTVRGYRYQCPFCRTYARAFRPFGRDLPILREKEVVGGGLRPDAQCPGCGSLDRERLLLLFLRHRTDLFATARRRVLHLAPEPQLTHALQSHGHLDVVTADLGMQDVMITLDVTALPFSDEVFDTILCNHVLEHVPDDRQALRELHRAMKPGGWAILQVPISLALDRTYEDFSITDPEAREAIFGQFDHVRLYARDYRARLAAAGFDVAVFDWTVEPGSIRNRRNRSGLNRKEAVFLAARPTLPGPATRSP